MRMQMIAHGSPTRVVDLERGLETGRIDFARDAPSKDR
jgi:hypothetical protein